MKSLLEFVAHIIVFWALTYFLFAFGAGTFSVAEWSEGSRISCIIIFLVWGWLSLAATAEKERREK